MASDTLPNGAVGSRGKFHPLGVQEITWKEVQTADCYEINLLGNISGARKTRDLTGSG